MVVGVDSFSKLSTSSGAYICLPVKSPARLLLLSHSVILGAYVGTLAVAIVFVMSGPAEIKSVSSCKKNSGGRLEK